MRAFIKKIEKGEVRRLALNAWKRMETQGRKASRQWGRQISNVIRLGVVVNVSG